MTKRTLPGLELEAFFDVGEDGWADEVDENFRKLSLFAFGQAKSRTTDLPGSGSAGDIYIIPEDDVSNGDSIAIWDGPSGSETWVVYDPWPGLLMYVADDSEMVLFGSGGWSPFESGSPDLAGLTDVLGAGSATSGQILVATGLGQFQFQTISFSATLAGLTDVVAAGSATVGQILAAVGDGTFEFIDNEGGSGGATALGELSDVDDSTAATGQVLTKLAGGGYGFEDVSGGGSGGGDPTTFDVPDTGWSLQDSGSSLVGGYVNGVAAIVKSAATGVAFLYNANGLVAGGDFTRYVRVDAFRNDQGVSAAGVIVRDSASGRSMGVGIFGNNDRFYRQYWNGTSFVSEAPTAGILWLPEHLQPFTLKFERVGTTLSVYYCVSDAVDILLDTYTVGSTELPEIDQIGVYVNAIGAATGEFTFVSCTHMSGSRPPPLTGQTFGTGTADDPVPVITKPGTAENLEASDLGAMVEMTNAASNTLTIRTDSAAGFPSGAGAVVGVTQAGPGGTIIQAAAGVTINGVGAGGFTIPAQWQGVSLYKRGADEWVLQGAFAEV